MIEEAFTRTASRHRNGLAVIDGDIRITYRDLERMKDRLAHRMCEGWGLARGHRVALHLPNCWEFIVSFLALARIGAVCVPINTRWRAQEIEWSARALDISAVITNAALIEPWLVHGLMPRRRVWLEKEIADIACSRTGASGGRRERLEEEAAMYLLTSGSTGEPKVVARTHRSLVAGVGNVAAALGPLSARCYLSVVPFHHAHGLANSMFLPLIHGGTTVPMRHFTPAGLAETVRRECVRVLVGSPFVFSLLLESGRNAQDFATVDIGLASGAAMSRELARRCAEELGIAVRQLYGSSETGPISVGPPSAGVESGCVGRPFPGIEVRIADPNGAALPMHAEGEVLIKSPTMMKAYLQGNEPEDRGFVDGYFRTGDLGRFDLEGNLIVSGRIQHRINLAGIKVDPVEIENVLRLLPEVRDCCVRGRNHPRQGEIIEALIVVRPARILTRRMVVEHCRRNLAEYKIPRVIEFHQSIPRDLMSKLPDSWRHPRDADPERPQR
jgi:long-chain acyl-CoA synthetase